MKKGLAHVLMMDAQLVLARLRTWFTYREGPESWDRVSLCSMAPLSADAFRHNMEAGQSHHDHTY